MRYFFSSSIGSIFGLPFLFLIFSIWVYFDAKKWRGRGVNVRPGVIAGLLLLIYYVIVVVEFGGGFFSYGYGYSYSTARFFIQFMPLIPPLILVGIYFYLRQVRYAKEASADNPPLPAAPAWTKWFFIAVFFLPPILAALAIIYFFAVFRGF